MLATQWLGNVRSVMEQIESTQMQNIREAATAMADTIQAGRWVHTFGCGHATLPVEEMYPRIGGFVGFHPMIELPLTFFTRITGEMGIHQFLYLERAEGYGVEIMKGAGFNVVPLPATELATALQTGLVNACSTTPQVAVLSQYYNYAKNMTDMPWALLLGATVIKKDVWDRIPADLHAPLLKAMQDAGAKLQADVRKGGDTGVDAMKKRGLNVVPVDAKTRARRGRRLGSRGG